MSVGAVLRISLPEPERRLGPAEARVRVSPSLLEPSAAPRLRRDESGYRSKRERRGFVVPCLGAIERRSLMKRVGSTQDR